MRFTCCRNFNVPSFFDGWRYIDFQTSHFDDFKQFGQFANLGQFTIDSNFSTFKQVTSDPSLLRRTDYGVLLVWAKH